MHRRRLLAGLGASAAGAVPSIKLLAQAPSTECVLTTDGDEGPFYFDAKLVRSNIAERREGVPLELTMRIVSAGECQKLEGARVDVWHSDALGVYSSAGRTFLRGTQFTGADGSVVFRTIYPSWYSGRTPHIHFKVFLANQPVVTNQIIFPDDVNDQVFRSSPPYREHYKSRDTFNANDAVLKRDGSGVLCEITEQNKGRYRAAASIGIHAGARDKRSSK